MSAVVLRCDNCGTSQSVLGLCEACHEGQVRYFCKNHNPGRWLNGPKCTLCGATYGIAAGPPPTRPAAATDRTGSTRKRPVSDGPAPTSPPPRRRGPWGSRPTRSEEILVSDELIARARAVERLRRLLGGAGYSRPVPDSTDYGPSAPRIAGGCFRVILLFMLFFLLLSLLGSYFGTMMLGF